jgi:hypothetical protein
MPAGLGVSGGSTTLRYQARAIDDLHSWLEVQGDWVVLGSADENKPAAVGTVEALGLAEVTHDARNNQMRAI